MVKTGDIVKVKVLEVDVARQRISLSMKTDASPTAAKSDHNQSHSRNDHRPKNTSNYNAPVAAGGSAMASAFAKLQGLKK